MEYAIVVILIMLCLFLSVFNYSLQEQMRRMFPRNEVRYKHYKGGIYYIVGWARHSETMEDLIVYAPDPTSATYEPGRLWVRPEDMFFGEIDGIGPRFTKIP